MPSAGLPTTCDAVVVGAGHNGLVAANLLADAGWDVVVLEAEAEPGGAVRSGEITAPVYVSDLFSAFYPLAAASPVLRELHLDGYGLRWRHAPLVLAHPRLDGTTAALSRDLDVTAASLDEFAAGDGHAWRRLFAEWEVVGDALVESLLRPFPPVRGATRLARATGPRGALRLARRALVPVRSLARERFAGEGAAMLLAGNALHADLSPEGAMSGLFGWLLTSLGQQVGFPVPEGGAGGLTRALVERLRAHGGELHCEAVVERVVVRGGRATGVVVGGRTIRARHAVLADVLAPQLYGELLPPGAVPEPARRDLQHFDAGVATVKVDWALDAPVPWASDAARQAGTVHLCDSLDDLSRFAFELATDHVPSRPFVVFGQMTTTDPTRSPPGTESAWAYTHVPQRAKGDAGGDIRGVWDGADTRAIVDRIEQHVERWAPGFRSHIVGRHVFTPVTFAAANRSLAGGAINGGTAQLHQQLVLRPVPGLGRSETPVEALYLASSSAHPGGGVHGACGANAARAARFHARTRGVLWRGMQRALWPRQDVIDESSSDDRS